MLDKRSTQTVVTPERRVVRYRKDMVGNDLTASLLWCETHQEPLWVYPDQSFHCPYDRVIGYMTEEHTVVVPPWENQ